MRNVWNSAINIGTFTLKNTETNQVLALDSVVLDSGERVIVAFGNGDIAAKAQFILANNYPDQNLSEDGLYWQWQTDLILGDDAARLQLFENNIKRDELRYGNDIGKLAENDSSQDSVYVLRRQGYEEGQNASDYPEYSRQTQGWQATDGVAIIYGGYVLRPLFLKHYELKDHLGNVRVIVSDVKDATLGTHGEPLSFAALIEHYSHYYPFGMEKPSMVFDKGAYRYGFNGKENDDEVKGVANSVDFGARVYDSRAARWLSLDPLAAKYPSMSAYNAMGDNPILFLDADGREIVPSNGFLASDYGAVYRHLRANNQGFNQLIFCYNQNKISNLYLDFKPLSKSSRNGETNCYIQVNSFNHTTVTGLNGKLDFQDRIFEVWDPGKVSKPKKIERTDIARARTIIHEALHAYTIYNEISPLIKDKGNVDQAEAVQLSYNKSNNPSHNRFNEENNRNMLVNALWEYNEDNNLGYSKTQINEFCFSGTYDSEQYKSYVNGLVEGYNKAHPDAPTTFKEQSDALKSRNNQIEWGTSESEEIKKMDDSDGH